MKRRNFLGWVSVGMVASSLPVAIALCADQAIGADGFQAVGTISELDRAGQILKEEFGAGALLVFRNAAGTIVAVDPTCTHNGCTVNRTGNSFSCPCHGAKFAANGQVTQGPAKRPLSTYKTKIQGDTILVK